MGRNQEIVKECVSDEEIEVVFENTHFGANPNYREIVADSVLKVAAGYAIGGTAMAILQELSLVGKRLRSDQYRYNLTKKGKKYLFYSQKVLREESGVKIKPLQWASRQKSQWCSTAVGHYEVAKDGFVSSPFACQYPTYEEAISACNEDYYRKVNSMLGGVK